MDSFSKESYTGSLGFSIDVEDLFYIIPHGVMFVSVRECIERNRTIAFQNACGFSVGGVLERLKFYLESNLITYDSGLYDQKEGNCVESCVAPVICDIFLAYCDLAICDQLDDEQISKVFRHVDHYLVVIKGSECVLVERTVMAILDVFTRCSEGLRFTQELRGGRFLQFLDLRLKFIGSHVCLSYNPRSKKGLLPLDCLHS